MNAINIYQNYLKKTHKPMGTEILKSIQRQASMRIIIVFTYNFLASVIADEKSTLTPTNGIALLSFSLKYSFRVWLTIA